MSEFDVKLTRDSRLNDITDKVTLYVGKGSSSEQLRVYRANSSTASSLVWNITPASESVSLERAMVFDVTVPFTLFIGTQAQNANIPVGTLALQLGSRDGLQAYPFNQLINTITFTMNGLSISLDQQNMMSWLPRFWNQKDQQEYFYTPTKLDNYFYHYDGVNQNNNPLAGYGQTANDGVQPRGTHQITVDLVQRYDAGVLQDNSLVSGGLTNYWVINCSVRLIEPILVSPLVTQKMKLMASKSNLIGVNDFAVDCTLDANMTRFWSTGLNTGCPYTLAVTGGNYTNPNLLFLQMSLDESQLVPAKTLQQYVRYRKFLSQNNLPQLLAGDIRRQMSSNNFQVDSVPSKFIFYVKRRLADHTPYTSFCNYFIESLSINFNNYPNLLSDFDSFHLYRMSVDNGLENISYDEWKSSVTLYDAGGRGRVVPSIGSIIIVDPVKDLGAAIPLYVSNGSSGQFNLSYDAYVTNTTGANANVELHCWALYDNGYLRTVSGQTNNVDYIINKNIVMDAVQQAIALDSDDSVTQTLQGGAYDKSVAKQFDKLMKSKGGARSGGARSAGSSRLDSLAF